MRTIHTRMCFHIFFSLKKILKTLPTHFLCPIFFPHSFPLFFPVRQKKFWYAISFSQQKILDFPLFKISPHPFLFLHFSDPLHQKKIKKIALYFAFKKKMIFFPFGGQSIFEFQIGQKGKNKNNKIDYCLG